MNINNLIIVQHFMDDTSISEIPQQGERVLRASEYYIPVGFNVNRGDRGRVLDEDLNELARL